ncbi:alpha/beta hydrolase family protein [Nocardia yamanashiensis]|uniref:alpha/beta hydrolase family protein n=1 Tax=Nocardia yamanashiensis TaxID=209247 RepID=UPI000833DFAF|nr:prolyl oligopeptidase family serine peptidase [Nocardia yamanashiensis]
MRSLLAATLSLLLLTAAPTAAAEDVTHEDARIGTDEATIWHPAHADHRLPVALLLTGANVHRSYYSAFAEALARYGFVVVAPEHFLMPGYSLPSEYEVDDVLTWARTQAATNSDLGALIDPSKLVIAGHSYGGATALYAAADRCQMPFCFGPSYRHPPELRAIVGHGTNTTIGPYVDSVAVQGIPVMYINGTEDGVSEPPEAHESFTRMSGTPAAVFVNILGANHFGLTDQDNPPGASPDLRPATAPRAQTISTAARWTAMWFLAQLGDTEAHRYVYEVGPSADPAVRVEIP